MTRPIQILALALGLLQFATATSAHAQSEDGWIQISPEGTAQVPGSLLGTDQDVTLQAVMIHHDASGEPASVEPILVGQITAEPTLAWTTNFPYGRSVTLGVIVGRRTCDAMIVAAGCTLEGVLIEGSVAEEGQMVSVGWAQRSWGFVMLAPITNGIAGKLTAFRTDNRGDYEPGQVYVGPQVDISFMLGRLSAGFLARVSGSQPGRAFLPVLGFGLGF